MGSLLIVKKEMKKNLNKYILWLVLVLSWLVFTFIYVYSRSNLTVILTDLSDTSLNQKTFNELLKGQRITGGFTASENYLGQVLVRFYNYNRINKDSVDFRLKEKGQSAWYYEHTYKTDQFLPNNLFTFGFPPITDSKGKSYEFEIESVQGQPEDAVTLSQKRPLLALEYQYPKSLIIKNPSKAMEFAQGKITTFNFSRDFLVNLITYIDFMTLIVFLEYLLLTSLNRYSLKVRGISSSYLITASLLVMFLSAAMLYLKKPVLSESVAIISYFLLVLGVFWFLWEQKTKNK
jgi:hypothetical protein